MNGHARKRRSMPPATTGDVIEVRPGEVVPADARLVEAVDVEADESSLTGESLPVPKQVEATPGAALAERSCMLHASDDGGRRNRGRRS